MEINLQRSLSTIASPLKLPEVRWAQGDLWEITIPHCLPSLWWNTRRLPGLQRTQEVELCQKEYSVRRYKLEVTFLRAERMNFLVFLKMSTELIIIFLFHCPQNLFLFFTTPSLVRLPTLYRNSDKWYQWVTLYCLAYRLW